MVDGLKMLANMDHPTKQLSQRVKNPLDGESELCYGDYVVHNAAVWFASELWVKVSLSPMDDNQVVRLIAGDKHQPPSVYVLIQLTLKLRDTMIIDDTNSTELSSKQGLIPSSIDQLGQSVNDLEFLMSELVSSLLTVLRPQEGEVAEEIYPSTDVTLADRIINIRGRIETVSNRVRCVLNHLEV